MSTTAIWLSYDLGINGDYDGLYKWLAEREAKECGDSFAFLPRYEYHGDVLAALRTDLSKAVELGKRARVYVIATKPNGHPKGSFLFGGRRLAPWHGYVPATGKDADDEG